jgi:hypothetical protein
MVGIKIRPWLVVLGGKFSAMFIAHSNQTVKPPPLKQKQRNKKAGVFAGFNHKPQATS